MTDKPKKCKDCPPTSKRKATYPGPRCYSHSVARKKAQKVVRNAKRDQSVYGLGPGEYDTILTYQGGVCNICRKATGKTRRLAVDHDHETGLVRQIACKSCNFILLGRYDVAALQRAIDSLMDPPAPKALGRKVYVPDYAKNSLSEWQA